MSLQMCMLSVHLELGASNGDKNPSFPWFSHFQPRELHANASVCEQSGE